MALCGKQNRICGMSLEHSICVIFPVLLVKMVVMGWVCRRSAENKRHVKKALSTAPLLKRPLLCVYVCYLYNRLPARRKSDVVWCGRDIQVFQRNMLHHMIVAVYLSRTVVTAYTITGHDVP